MRTGGAVVLPRLGNAVALFLAGHVRILGLCDGAGGDGEGTQQGGGGGDRINLVHDSLPCPSVDAGPGARRNVRPTALHSAGYNEGYGESFGKNYFPEG